MIYETAFVLRADATEDAIKKAKENVAAAIKEFGGEVLIDENWGVNNLLNQLQTVKQEEITSTLCTRLKTASLNVELERRLEF
jgi:ribosomal protein S6